MNLIEIGEKAKIASREVAKLTTEEKNAVLRACADALLANKVSIIAANDRDITRGREKGMPENLQDRLMLSDDRIKGMAEGILEMERIEGMNVKRDFSAHQPSISLPVLIGAIAVGLEGKTSEEDVVVYPVAEE